MLNKILPFVIIILIAPIGLFGQTNYSKNYKKNLQEIYFEEINGLSPLFQGFEYYYSGYNIEGHPYFISDRPSEATIKYNDIEYDDINVLYDLLQDEVLVINKNNSKPLILIKGKIEYLEFLGHYFININNEIYDLVYDGEIDVLVKRVKEINEEVVQESTIHREYLLKEDYLIRYDNTLYPINNKSSLLFHLKQHKRAIKRHLRNQGIKFNKDKELAIITAVYVYEEL